MVSVPIGVFFHPLGPFCPHLALLFVYRGLSRVGGSSTGLLMVKDEACGQLIGGCAHTDLSSSSASLWSVLELTPRTGLTSHIQLFGTPWTIAHQAPLSMGFSRQEDWRGLSCPPPGESSQPRDGTQDSCIAGGFFTVQTAREALTTAEMLNLESPWFWLTRRVLLLSSPAAPAGRASGLQQGHCVWT